MAHVWKLKARLTPGGRPGTVPGKMNEVQRLAIRRGHHAPCPWTRTVSQDVYTNIG